MFKMIIDKLAVIARGSLNVIREYSASFRISDDEFEIRPLPSMSTITDTCVASSFPPLTPAEEVEIEDLARIMDEILMDGVENRGHYELCQPMD